MVFGPHKNKEPHNNANVQQISSTRFSKRASESHLIAHHYLSYLTFTSIINTFKTLNSLSIYIYVTANYLFSPSLLKKKKKKLSHSQILKIYLFSLETYRNSIIGLQFLEMSLTNF